MHSFLSSHRDELIARCKEKVAQRPRRAATAEQLANGVPLFLEQLTKTLEAEEQGDAGKSLRISGAAGGDATALSEIGVSAAVHGKRLLELGFNVNQVVHDYGDLCQAITDLAVERDEPFSVDQFRTLNRCLDNAIADAVTEFSVQRDATVARRLSDEEHERLGVLVHELRNHLHTAVLAFSALESGTLPIGGSTGGVLKRSLTSLSTLLSQALTEVRLTTRKPVQTEAFSLATFIVDACTAASLYSDVSGGEIAVPEVDPLINVTGNRELLLAALVNLLHNALKFTRPHTEVTLSAYADGDRVLIEVKDNCGGLPAGAVGMLFKPFTQVGNNRKGLGLGLSIAKRSVEASGGALRVRDVPGVGCIFTMDLPRERQQ